MKIVKLMITLEILLGGLIFSTFALSDEVNVSNVDNSAPVTSEASQNPTWSFPSSVALVSDYIWRGQSQTWGNPALQAGIEIDHSSGLYLGLWGSNVSSHWLPNANLETDWSIGYRNTIFKDFKYDIGGVYVFYPDGNFSKVPVFKYAHSRLDTLEIYGSISWQWLSLKAGFNPTQFYGWNPNNSGGPGVGANSPSFPGDLNAGVIHEGNTRWSHYLQADVSYDMSGIFNGFNISGEIGHQYIEDSTGLDWTWYKIGITRSFDYGIAVNAFLTGTSGSSAFNGFPSFDNANDVSNVDKTKLVFGITKSF